MLNLQNINWKKMGLIIGFILAVIGIGFLIYFMFFRTAPSVTPPPPTGELGQLPGAQKGAQPGLGQKPGEKAPIAPGEKILKIPATSQQAVADTVAAGGITKVNDLDYKVNQSLTMSNDGTNLQTYNPDDGKFYRIAPDGTKTALSSRAYKDVKNVTWSPKKNEVILKFPDGSNVLYNFDTDKQISLPKDWTEFSFDGTGDKIAFKDMNANPDYRWVGTASKDGSNQKYIEPIGTKSNNFKVDWSPNGKVLAEYNTGKTGEMQKLYFLGQYGENFRAIDVNGYGLETQWTPSGNKLLYSANNANTDHKPALYIVDASGENIGYNHQPLNLNTWAYKCSFEQESTVYCAVPKTLPYGADYVPEIADTTPDYIYKVDLNTGVKSFVAEPEFDYTVEQLQVSADGSDLFFTDKATGALHSIKLK